MRDAPADEIADIYSRRWQIEMFLRLLKPTPRKRHVFGRPQGAVSIQVGGGSLGSKIVPARAEVSLRQALY